MHEELERDEFMLQSDEGDLDEETTELEEADLEGADEDDDFPEIPEEEQDR